MSSIGAHRTESPLSGPSAGLATDPTGCDEWFRTKVLKALANGRPAKPHEQVMRKT